MNTNSEIKINSNLTRSKKRMQLHLLSNICLLLFSLACIIPFLMLLSVSFSSEKDVVAHGYKLIPEHFDLTAYRYVFKTPRALLDAYGVTALVTVVGTALSITVMSMMAYALSRKHYKRRNAVSVYVFFTMLFSGGMVPSYILISQYLHLKDTIWVLFLSGTVNAWHVILLRTFFQEIPESIFESARMDGASEFNIFLRMVLPLSTPAIATISLFGILARWNDWFTCMLYINNEKLFTLQYLLQKIMMNVELLKTTSMIPMTLNGVVDVPSETLRMAMAVLVAGPIVFVFPFFQKYFVKGITVGSVKG